MSKHVDSTCDRHALAEINQSGDNSLKSAKSEQKEEKHEGEEDDPVHGKRRKKDNSTDSDCDILRFKPLVVRIGSYKAPIHGDVELNSDGFIFPTITVKSEEPTKNVRLELRTSEITGVWAYLGEKGGSPCIIVYTSVAVATNICSCLNMPKIETSAAPDVPFFCRSSRIPQCDVLAKLRKRMQNLKTNRGDHVYRDISRKKSQDIITLTQRFFELRTLAINGAPLSRNEEPAAKDSLKDIFDTTCLCVICKSTRNEPLLCKNCARIFCVNCFSTKHDCTYCSEKGTKTGLIECSWVRNLVALLKSALTADWGVGNPCQEVIESLKKANENLKCQVCYETAKDAVLCPHCSMLFCRSCIKVSLTAAKYHFCSWCYVDVTEKDLVPCHWGEKMGRILDKLLLANKASKFLDDPQAGNEEMATTNSSRSSDSNASCDDSEAEEGSSRSSRTSGASSSEGHSFASRFYPYEEYWHNECESIDMDDSDAMSSDG